MTHCSRWHAAGNTEEKKEREKPSWWKCSCGPYTSHLSISQLPNCWFRPICLWMAQKEVLLGHFRKAHGLSSAWIASSWMRNFCGQDRAKSRPGQAWIDDISCWFREALPSLHNQSPLHQQLHSNLSEKSFAFPHTPSPPCPPLLLCQSLPDINLTAFS